MTRRMARLRALGLAGQQPDQELDEFAAKLAQVTDAPFTMVNFVVKHSQYFAGPTEFSQASAALYEAQPSAHAEPAREMPVDTGYCPHVVVRRKALVLDDVCDYLRFASNPVVDKPGIRPCLGAPLIDRTGTALGTGAPLTPNLASGAASASK